jgi:NAD(P)-dependent dehydrogenase (short-subunit alcohol dehydrogenase family)
MGVLDGKAVVITGSGRGLGKAYAVAAAQAGAAVVVNDVSTEHAESVASEINVAGGTAVASAHSVSDFESAQALASLCVAEFGRIDGLVNNAALAVLEPAWESTPETMAAVVGVNVLGLMYCGASAMRQMRKQHSGVIINVTSGAQLGLPGLSIYGATKGAVTSATYSWAIDAAADGISVIGFAPSARTDMATGLLVDKYLPPPETIAPAVVYLLSDAAHGLSGQIVRFEGRRLRLLIPPRLSEQFVERETWDVDSVAEALEELRPNLQPVGRPQPAPYR